MAIAPDPTHQARSVKAHLESLPLRLRERTLLMLPYRVMPGGSYTDSAVSTSAQLR
jgi:hypothetical protein